MPTLSHLSVLHDTKPSQVTPASPSHRSSSLLWGKPLSLPSPSSPRNPTCSSSSVLDLPSLRDSLTHMFSEVPIFTFLSHKGLCSQTCHISWEITHSRPWVGIGDTETSPADFSWALIGSRNLLFTCLVSLIPSPKKYVLLWLWFWERRWSRSWPSEKPGSTPGHQNPELIPEPFAIPRALPVKRSSCISGLSTSFSPMSWKRPSRSWNALGS